MKTSTTFLKNLAQTANEVEFYYFKDKVAQLHTDFIECDDDLSLENLPNEIECQWEIMDADRYEETVLANSCVSISDIYSERSEVNVLVIVLTNEQYWEIKNKYKM